MSVPTVLLVLLAGAAGATLRAVVVAARPRSGTTLVNLVGTLLLAVTVALAGSGRLGPEAAAVLGPGLAGALTTFSGWVARVDAGLRDAPVGTFLGEVLLPLLGGVGLTVLAFVVLA